MLGNELRGGEVLGKMLSDLVGKGLDDVLVLEDVRRSARKPCLATCCSERQVGSYLERCSNEKEVRAAAW